VVKRLEAYEDQFQINLVGENQHGARKNRSTITAAKIIQAEISADCDNDMFVAVGSLDKVLHLM